MGIKTGIIGASGYTGAELLRLLHGHPEFDVVVATANSQAGKSVTSLYPHLNSYIDLDLQHIDDVVVQLADCDLVFSGLPHGLAMGVLPGLSNRVIVDIGSDFRLRTSDDYVAWYGRAHTAPEELGHWVYGAPELFKDEIRNATRIANPGCFATAVYLACAPLVTNNLVTGVIVANALTGTSGGGRVEKPAFHFSHVYEDVRAYKLAAHQHTPEIEMVLSSCAKHSVTVGLTPHLVPISRGIHATISAELTSGTHAASVVKAFEELYADAPFVQLTDTPSGTKEVRGSNFIFIHICIDVRTNRVIVTSVIDNLVKGASGQAIQNANLALGLPETCGLTHGGMYP